MSVVFTTEKKITYRSIAMFHTEVVTNICGASTCCYNVDRFITRSAIKRGARTLGKVLHCTGRREGGKGRSTEEGVTVIAQRDVGDQNVLRVAYACLAAVRS
jgi:hypothetical protein